MNDTVPPPASTPAPVHDEHFGEITVRLEEQGYLVVEGARILPGTLRRNPGAKVDEQVAIGTRAPEQLTLAIGGTAATLRPAKGGLSRRSYRVDAEYDGAKYRLLPDSIPSSRLTRDGRHIGDFSSDGDGRVSAEWCEGADVRPADASVGYALAAAFGTGGQPWWMLTADAVSSALP